MMQDQERKSEGSPIDSESAWTAVLARDPLSDGGFVYAVSTTGVYCRPICTSRRPLQRNVEFFATAEAAEEAGYRACRRCRPDRAIQSAAIRAVEQAREYLDNHADETVTLERLGKEVFTSPFHLQRTFKRRVGLTMTPATYRKGGEGARIRYATVPCALGRLLVGATDRGICSVSLGDDEAELVRALQREYPRAELERADGEFQRWVGEITRYLSGEARTLDLPLDLDATAFQLRVWRALQQIPFGSTRSYSEIAAEIGAPTATRAVAHACATNRAALVIPCHRVVRTDGGLGGYRWGMERKRRLLQQERSRERA